MRSFMLSALILSLTLGACATSPRALPICDGKHRRPANPHGSVLDPTGPAPTAASPIPAPPSPAAPPPTAGCGR
jgi:type IV secretion system protein VirB7